MGVKYKNKYRSESARLPDYDYSRDGLYYVTICTKDRLNLFGVIEDNQMILNDFGRIVYECWFDLPNHYPNLQLDEFIVMPNHLHLILSIKNNKIAEAIVCTVETGLRPVSAQNYKKHGLSEFVRALKSFSTRRINKIRKSKYPEIWQNRFYEHVIRNETDYIKIRDYIRNNPLNWKHDENN